MKLHPSKKRKGAVLVYSGQEGGYERGRIWHPLVTTRESSTGAPQLVSK